MPARKRVIVNRLKRQQAVAGSAEKELVQDRRAGAVGVDPHICFRDRHQLHGRVKGVLVLGLVDDVATTLLLLLRSHPGGAGGVQIHHVVFVDAHGNDVGRAHIGAVAKDIKLSIRPRVAVDEELFGRDRVDAHPATGVAPQNAQVVQLRQNLGHLRQLGGINRLARSGGLLRHLLRHLDLLPHGLNRLLIRARRPANHLNARLVQQGLVLVVVQIGEIVHRRGVVILPVGFGDARNRHQRVMRHVADDPIPVGLTELGRRVHAGLLHRCHVLGAAGDEINRAVGCHKDALDRRLDRAHRVAALRGHDLATALLLANVDFSVEIALHLDPARRDFRINEVNRVVNGGADDGLNILLGHRLEG